MKTIGVLGGIGPQATMDFVARVHRVSQQRIPQSAVSGYPPLVVVYFREAPVLLTGEGKPVLPLQPNPRFLAAASHLGALADFLVVTSNGPYLFQAELEQASGLQMVSMIDATLQEVKRRGWRKVGVLGLGEPSVYTQRHEELDGEFLTIEGELQDELDQAIFKVMEGAAGESERAVAARAIAALRDAGAEGTILGCTEIPFLLSGVDEDPELINPAQLLAEAVVDAALS